MYEALIKKRSEKVTEKQQAKLEAAQCATAVTATAAAATTSQVTTRKRRARRRRQRRQTGAVPCRLTSMSTRKGWQLDGTGNWRRQSAGSLHKDIAALTTCMHTRIWKYTPSTEHTHTTHAQRAQQQQAKEREAKKRQRRRQSAKNQHDSSAKQLSGQLLCKCGLVLFCVSVCPYRYVSQNDQLKPQTHLPLATCVARTEQGKKHEQSARCAHCACVCPLSMSLVTFWRSNGSPQSPQHEQAVPACLRLLATASYCQLPRATSSSLLTAACSYRRQRQPIECGLHCIQWQTKYVSWFLRSATRIQQDIHSHTHMHTQWHMHWKSISIHVHFPHSTFNF